jgi:excisionase family DNA binding protein
MKAATRSAVSTLLAADASIPADRIPLAFSILEGASLPASQPAAVQRDLLTVAEAADYLRCSRSSLWRMEQDGDIQAVYVRGKKLFRLEDLQGCLTTRGGE